MLHVHVHVVPTLPFEPPTWLTVMQSVQAVCNYKQPQYHNSCFIVLPTICSISMTAAQTCKVQGTPIRLNPGS